MYQQKMKEKMDKENGKKNNRPKQEKNSWVWRCKKFQRLKIFSSFSSFSPTGGYNNEKDK